MTGFTFFIDDASTKVAIPGEDGYRVHIRDDGSEELRRYFAVTFANTFYNRFVQASKENDHDVRCLAFFMRRWFVSAT